MSDLEKLHVAWKQVQAVVRRTPILSSPFLDEIAGRSVLVKAECLQHTGSFKLRGAWAALTAMTEEERKKGILAYSSGNHAQGVALAASRLGVPATVVMPSDAPKLKIENTKMLGANVVLYDRATESREEIGEALQAKHKLTLVKPFDDPWVIAGQGSVGLEIAEQVEEDHAEVLVCAGGGGLTAGIALALSEKKPNFLVRPVEPEGFDDMTRSLETGQIQQNARTYGSLCDAIVTPHPGELTFPIIKALCGRGLVVTDHQALQAVAAAFLRLKIVVEPGGAVALAAALFSPDIQSDTVIAVATGGNIDPEIFQKALNTL